MVGHERNINRAAALVRNPSLRRSADMSTEPKKASASKTVPVHVFACRRALDLDRTVTARPAVVTPVATPVFKDLPVFIPSSATLTPPAFAPPLRPVFIETPDVPPRPEDMPSVTSSETSSITSDTVSEMSVDSSGDCSSLMSTEDSSDWEQPGWVRECTGSLQRALSRFNLAPNITPPSNPQLATRRAFCTSTPSLFVPDNRKFGLQLLKEQNGNEVVIREMKAGRVSRFSEVKCESVRSRIQKLQNRSWPWGTQQKVCQDWCLLEQKEL